MASDSENEESKKEEQEKSCLFKFFTNPERLFQVSVGFILFALIAPVLFTHCSTGVVFEEGTTDISSGISIMNPFIAIAAAIITFAAFWVQYKANMDLREEAKKDREQAKIDRQDNQKERDKEEKRNRKQQIISRFYEMLQIHRENVKELEWNQGVHYGMNDSEFQYEDKFSEEENSESEYGNKFIQKRGRQVFFYHLLEFDFIYSIVDSLYPELETKDKVKKTYNIFYKNENDERFDYNIRTALSECIQKYNSARSVETFFIYHKKSFSECFNDCRGAIDVTLNHIYYFKDYFKLQPLFKKGHFEELNNYYRHLFLTVKTIANEDEKYLSYNEKRDLLRILRAQLTNTEQIMLFYNWFSGNGSQWEQDDPNGNHFFTQYRMVHNIIPKRFLQICLLDGHDKAVESLINYLKKQPIYTYIKKYCSKNDPMFEFEQWEGHPKFDYDK